MSLAGEQSPAIVLHPDAVTLPTSVSDQVPYALQVRRHLAVVLPQGHAKFTQLRQSLHCLIVLTSICMPRPGIQRPRPPALVSNDALAVCQLVQHVPSAW